MTKLKLTPIADDKPVKITPDLPARIHRDLLVYAQALGGADGTPPADAGKLIIAMVDRFMATDRAFAKLKRQALA